MPDTTTGSVTLPAASLGQVGSLTQIYAVHLEALSAPPSATANSTDPTISVTLKGRPLPGPTLCATALEPTLISSASPDTTTRPFAAQNYAFYKTIRFNPHGEANVNGNRCLYPDRGDRSATDARQTSRIMRQPISRRSSSRASAER